MGKAARKAAKKAALAPDSPVKQPTYDKTKLNEFYELKQRFYHDYAAKDHDVRRVDHRVRDSEFYRACKVFGVHGEHPDRREFTHPNMIYGTQQDFHMYHPDELQQQLLGAWCTGP